MDEDLDGHTESDGRKASALEHAVNGVPVLDAPAEEPDSARLPRPIDALWWPLPPPSPTSLADHQRSRDLA